MVAEAHKPDANGPVASAAEPASGAGLRLLDGEALDPLVQPQCSLSVQLRRATGSIVGRTLELTAIEQSIRDARNHLTAVTLEGEPGIGKTRLLIAAAEMATAAGFATVAITADEEIRGPFLVARSLFGNGALRETAVGTRAEVAVRRVTDALSGRDEPGFETLSPDAKLLRTFDLAGIAIQELATVKPIALLLDDVQWADDDTLRMLRYAIRSVAEQPVFLFLNFRSDELAKVAEAVNFIADMERMGLVRRLRVSRFAAAETALLLRQVLGGPVDGQSVAAMHAQSEGVPFIVEELARTHREAGTLQQSDGEWRLGRNAARLVPSAVRTLISRRAARLPAPTLALLGDAGVLGRSFSVRDLVTIGGAGSGAAAGLTARDADDRAAEIAEALAPAVEAGLLLPHPEGDAADYTFTHEQVRDFSTAQLSNARRREVHRAVVDLLLEGGEPPAEGLQMLAQHALAAGDNERAARFSIDAATAALKSNAPEEALRLVEAALPVVSAVADRRTLLACRDDAFAVLRRSTDRLDGLAELGALAEASKDRPLEIDVQLRRAAALRAGHDEDAAAELARRVRERAAADGDTTSELRATLELGQALTQSTLGEGFGVSDLEVDVDAAEEAFARAIELATELGDERSLAAAEREAGMLALSRVRTWFVGEVKAGKVQELARRVLAGEELDAVLKDQPVAPLVMRARGHCERALEIFIRLDDRTGVMSTVILMAYINYAPAIHLNASARHLEEIRRVTSRFAELVTESERERQELQMLFGVHVFARAKVVPDLAINARRGGVPRRKARRRPGDGVPRRGRCGADPPGARRHRGGGALARYRGASGRERADPDCERGRSSCGAAEPVPRRGTRMGCACTSSRPGSLANRAGAVARCEVAAWLAITAARLGARTADTELLALAEEAADQATALAASLPGHALWAAQADAARAEIAVARGDVRGGSSRGRRCVRGARCVAHRGRAPRDAVVRESRASSPAARQRCRRGSGATCSWSCRVSPRRPSTTRCASAGCGARSAASWSSSPAGSSPPLSRLRPGRLERRPRPTVSGPSMTSIAGSCTC